MRVVLILALLAAACATPPPTTQGEAPVPPVPPFTVMPCPPLPPATCAAEILQWDQAKEARDVVGYPSYDACDQEKAAYRRLEHALAWAEEEMRRCARGEGR